MTENTTVAKAMFSIRGFQGLSGRETASARERPPRNFAGLLFFLKAHGGCNAFVKA